MASHDLCIRSRSILCWVLVLATSLAFPTFSWGAARDGSSTDSPGAGITRLGGQQVRRYFSAGECLRVTAAGVLTRASSSPFAGGTITLPPGPTLANVVWAGLYWVILDDAPKPISVTLNGVAVAPTTIPLPVTASPCWPQASAFAYFADVTGLVTAGANTVAGLDDSGVETMGPSSEGASLVVVYRSDDSGACEIVVLDGNDLFVPPDQIDNPVALACPPGSPASLWFIGGDGQAVGDNQVWNTVILGDGDDFDSSDPMTAGAFPIGWDTDRWGVTVAAGGNVATLELASAGDCINWVATVVEVDVRPQTCEPTPAKSSTWGKLKSFYR